MAGFAVGPLEMLIVFLFSGIGIGLPLSTPPLPPDPVLLRAAPEECLFYLAANGMAAADPKSRNETERLVAEPEVRQFFARLDAELTGALRRNLQRDPAGAVAAEAAPPIVRMLLTRPLVFYLSRVVPQPNGLDLRGALVVSCGPDTGSLRGHLSALESLLLGGRPAEESMLEGVRLRRLPTPPMAPAVQWGFKDEYLIVALGAGSAEAALARLKQDVKIAPWLARLHEQLPVERPSVTSYLNIKGGLTAAAPWMTDPRIRQAIEALGFSKVQSMASVTGLDQHGTVSKSLTATEGPARGIFAALGEKPLAAADLRPIHRESNMGFALRMDLAQVYRQVLEGVGQVDPGARQQAEQQIAQLEEKIGFRIRDDLLQALGDVWCVYNSPAEGGAFFTGLAAAVSIRDREKLQRAHQRLLELLGDGLRQSAAGRAQLKEFTYRDTRVHYVQFSGTFVPVSPAWCLTKDHLVISPFPQMIKAYLARDLESGSLADVPQVAQALSTEGGATLVSYQDSAGFWQAMYSYIQMFAPLASSELAKQGIRFDLPELPSFAAIGPHIKPTLSLMRRTDAGLYSQRHQTIPGGGLELTTTAPVGIALLLPAVQAAREAARRAQSMNNLKQIGLGLHNYHDIHGSLPAPAIVDKAGKPLLSWRVQILPYLEQDRLYRQFRLDEPWDSEHNRKLIEKIPPTYVNPNLQHLAPEGKTVYLGAAGEGSLFAGPKGVDFSQVRDGTSNTITVVEAQPEKAVIWTRPDDFQLDKQDPLAGLRGARPGGFLALWADGSVQFISDNVDPATLRALFTRAGGETIDYDQLRKK